jgi:anhydro-N-acetylmuramic acid kinase
MLRVIGLISGTSADGIDAALCEIDGSPPHLTARVIRAHTIPYPPDLRERVLAAMRPHGADAAALCILNAEVGEAFAAAALMLEAGDTDLIGSHGQTVWHQVEADGRVTATLQLGEASVIAERSGTTVVHNFRARDIAAAGQGAPLVSYLDWLLLRHPSAWRAVQNIGGIGNVTLLPPMSEPNADMMAFDTGPGNALLDTLVSTITEGRLRYDAGGALAASGVVDEAWLAALLAHPYYALPPPKSTGRETFGSDYALHLLADGRARGLDDANIVATTTALTAASIAAAYRAFAPAPVGEAIIGGGGQHNAALLAMLRQRLPHTRISLSSDHGIDGDSKEALLFAVLAYETWHNRVGCLPAQTGALHASVLGQITPGDNYAALLRKTWGMKTP